MAFTFFQPTRRVTVTQGDLPHWDQEGATYFITWRLADSIPASLWKQWMGERQAWLLRHGIDPARPDWKEQMDALPETARQDFRRFTRSLEHVLDSGHGACVLKQPSLAAIVAETLHFQAGSRYVLGDYVIMPNHVHLIVGGLARQTMLNQVRTWKRWSATQINQALKQRGRLWQDESFDHVVRHEASFQKLRQYIADNPKKAGLKPGEYLHHAWQGPQE